MPLSPKQARFVDAYIVSLNASQAAREAGYRWPAKQGLQQLAKTSIQQALTLRQQSLASTRAITPERVIDELALVGFADMADYATWGPSGLTLKDSTTLPPGLTRIVGEVSETITEGGGSV